MPRRRIECCALDPRELGSDPPEWILLLPAGSPVRLRDGRTFASAGAEAVIAGWRRGIVDLPVDIDHASTWSDGAPAYGWVTAMEARDGAVWGRVEWTNEGRQTITSRRYRYYSPTFSIRATADALGREIYGIQSLALVNRPALPGIPALAREESYHMGDRIRAALGLPDDATEQQVVDAIAAQRGQPRAVDYPARIRQRLGLASTAGDEQVLAALEGAPAAAPAAGEAASATAAAAAPATGGDAAGAAPAATEPASAAAAAVAPAEQRQAMVPLADYQVLAARTRTAEETLRARDEADLQAAAAEAVDGAIRDRKVSPASRAYHLETCRTRADVDRFKAFAATAPELVATASAAPSGPPPAGNPDALPMATDPDARGVYEQLGLREGR